MTLAIDTIEEAQSVAEDLVEHGFWTGGRSKAGLARLTRAQTLIPLVESLRREQCTSPARALILPVMDVLVRELSTLAREALAAGEITMKHCIIETWYLTHLDECDADNVRKAA